MKAISLAIVGATGVVGRKFLEVLEERKIKIRTLVLFASERSQGMMILFQGKNYPVLTLNEANVKNNPVEYALFSAGSDVSLQYAPLFAKQKTLVIDNSAAWRMDPNVPLVVPEVNPQDAFKHQYIVANPNCSTIRAVLS